MSPRLSINLHESGQIVSRPELDAVRVIAKARLSPIRHSFVADCLTDYVTEQYPQWRFTDQIHGLTHHGGRYYGFFEFRDTASHAQTEVRWLLGMINCNDGSNAFELHSGLSVPGADKAMIFHCKRTIIKKYRFIMPQDVKLLVNESVDYLREHYVVALDRMEHYKRIKLTPEKAHDTICRVILPEIIAGRCAHELVTLWNSPKFEYLKPRTLWSLFVLCGKFLNRLKAPVMIERTEQLHDFFDAVAKYNKKATVAEQPNLI